MILAGDLGGTKCNLILFDVEGQHLRPVYRMQVLTAGFPSIEEFLAHFRKSAQREGHLLNNADLNCAGFGVAGAIVDDQVVCNNLPWTITKQNIAKSLNISPNRTFLLNDVEAAASSLAHLEAEDLLPLNDASPQARAPKLYLAAGTGLGES